MCVDVVETSRLCFFSGIHFMDSQIPKLALHFNRGRRSLKEIIPGNRWGVQKFFSFSVCFLHYASNFPTAVPNDTAVHVSLPYAASQAASNNITRCNSGFQIFPNAYLQHIVAWYSSTLEKLLGCLSVRRSCFSYTFLWLFKIHFPVGYSRCFLLFYVLDPLT